MNIIEKWREIGNERQRATLALLFVMVLFFYGYMRMEPTHVDGLLVRSVYDVESMSGSQLPIFFAEAEKAYPLPRDTEAKRKAYAEALEAFALTHPDTEVSYRYMAWGDMVVERTFLWVWMLVVLGYLALAIWSLRLASSVDFTQSAHPLMHRDSILYHNIVVIPLIFALAYYLETSSLFACTSGCFFPVILFGLAPVLAIGFALWTIHRFVKATRSDVPLKFVVLYTAFFLGAHTVMSALRLGL